MHSPGQHDLTCAATASEVTTIWRDINLFIIIIIIRLHLMHSMQPIATDDCGVCLSRGSTGLHCGKTAEWLKMLWGDYSWGPWKIVLDGGPDPPQ